MSREAHWEEIYRTKAPTRLSWYAPHLEPSLESIREVTGLSAEIIDVGGGSSTLVDDLLELGYSAVSVLDVCAASLAIARERLGDRAEKVTWIHGDVLSVGLPAARYDVWHDRAVFHFLTDPEDRTAYAGTARKSIKHGGHLIVTAFALDGPTRCSGLDVVRYSGEIIGAELGRGFVIEQETRHSHTTPGNAEQQFVHCLFRRDPGAPDP